MTSYIYVPVPTDEMRDFVTAWDEGREDKGKTPYTLLVRDRMSGIRKGMGRRFGDGVLECVAPADKLYILAHGAAASATAGTTQIGAQRQDGFKGYTPEKLAALVKAEGLTNDMHDVRIYACGSGDMTPGIPYAGLFKVASARLGYTHLLVTGYDADVKTSHAYRSGRELGTFTSGKHKGATVGGVIYRASEHRTRFG